MRRQVLDPRVLARIASVWYPLRFTFLQAEEVPDEYGAVTETWTNVIGLTGIPGTVVPLSQMEKRDRQTVTTETTHKLMLGGYFPQIVPKMRMYADNGFTYDILGVEQDPWNTFTQLTARILT